MKRLVPRITMPVLTLVLLAGVSLEAMTRPQPRDAEGYHARVQEAVAGIPYRLGDWLGEDTAIPREAQALLQPNALFGRRYRSMVDGTEAELVIVQCRSARDLMGHYPPRCYPANGYQQEKHTFTTWDVTGPGGRREAISGFEYEFSISSREQVPRKVVVSFMVLPDGRLMPDIKAVQAAAADYLRHFYGAAQVQVVMSSLVVPARRRAVVNELVGPILPVLDVIRNGDRP